MGAARSAVGAGVEALVAVGRQRLDRADRRHDLVADELQRGDDIVPFVGGRDLERLGAALAPGRGGADQLPERDDALDALGGEAGAEGAELGAVRGRAGEPGAEIRGGLARREARAMVVLVGGEAEFRGRRGAGATARRDDRRSGDQRPAARRARSGETAEEADAKASDAAIAADPINFSISKR